MSDPLMRVLSMALFLTCLSAMGFSGHPSVQAVLMVTSLLFAGIVAFGVLRSSGDTGFSTFLAWALVGALAFASWNLLGRPNARWAHRAFIYTIYGAAVAIILLATVLDSEERTEKAKWYITAGVYFVATASIAMLKSCFVERMMAEVPA